MPNLPVHYDVVPEQTTRDFIEVSEELRSQFELLPNVPITMALTPGQWCMIPEMLKQTLDARMKLAKLTFAVGRSDREATDEMLFELEHLTVAIGATLNQFTIALMSAAIRSLSDETDASA